MQFPAQEGSGELAMPIHMTKPARRFEMSTPTVFTRRCPPLLFALCAPMLFPAAAALAQRDAGAEALLEEIVVTGVRIRYVDDYNTLDLRLRYDITDEIELTLEGTNLLSEPRIDFRGLEGQYLQTLDTARGYSPAAGRGSEAGEFHRRRARN